MCSTLSKVIQLAVIQTQAVLRLSTKIYKEQDGPNSLLHEMNKPLNSMNVKGPIFINVIYRYKEEWVEQNQKLRKKMRQSKTLWHISN